MLINNLSDHIKEVIKSYPSLFGDDDKSKFRVLEHIFFVNGNGYRWEDGKLTIDEELKKLSDGEKQEEIKKFYEGSDKFREVQFYPLCKYAKLCTIPENVDKNYIPYIIEICNYALESPIESFCEEYMKNKNFVNTEKEIIKSILLRITNIDSKENWNKLHDFIAKDDEK